MISESAFDVVRHEGAPLDNFLAQRVLETVARATRSDGTAPLSEQVLKAVASEEPGTVFLVTSADRVLGYAGFADGTAEVVVDPESRGRGIGRELVSRALDFAGSEARVWAHGNLPAARAVAAHLDLSVVRELLQLRREAKSPELPEVVVPEGITLRTYRGPQDDAELLRVNNAAFAWHPEQGGWTDRDISERRNESWFDPAGVFLAFDEGTDRLLGFHWTKVHAPDGAEPAIGEVYVVGIDPESQGRGLGRVLTLAGLHYLAARDLAQVMLYVEADNEAAVHTYGRLGFDTYHVDAAYARTR